MRIASMVGPGLELNTSFAGVIGQIGAVWTLGGDLSTLGKDLGSFNIKLAGKQLWNTIYDFAVIPHYGFYGGAGWGIQQFKDDSMILNQGDYASYAHDVTCQIKCDNRGWVQNQWNGNPAYVPVGPLGSVYRLLGTGPFWLAPR
jgi:hypothetical protein